MYMIKNCTQIVVQNFQLNSYKIITSTKTEKRGVNLDNPFKKATLNGSKLGEILGLAARKRE